MDVNDSATLQGVSNTFDLQSSGILDIAYYTVRLVQSVIAISGNCLTMMIIVRTAELRTGTNVLIASLAFADLLSALVAPMSIVVSVYVRTVHWAPICHAKQILTLLNRGGTIHNVFFISLDRYLAVASPIRHLIWTTNRNILCLTVVSWAVLTIAISLLVLLSPPPTIKDNERLCFYSEQSPSWSMDYIVLPQFFLFSAVTLFLYCRMCYVVWKTHHQVSPSSGGPRLVLVGAPLHQTRQRKLTRTLTIVMGVYFTFTLPSVVLSVFVSHYNISVVNKVYYIAVVLWYNTACVNPVLYAWQAPGFRKAFKRMLRAPCLKIKNQLR